MLIMKPHIASENESAIKQFTMSCLGITLLPNVAIEMKHILGETYRHKID
jgi:hypothetical protein